VIIESWRVNESKCGCHLLNAAELAGLMRRLLGEQRNGKGKLGCAPANTTVRMPTDQAS